MSPQIFITSVLFSLNKHTDQSLDVSKETSSDTFLSPNQTNIGLCGEKRGVVAVGPFME